MDRGMSSAEQKLAEKLVILNRRGQGILTRIYNIKKVCSDPKSRPGFLADKALEQAIKQLVKKFPSMENNKAPHMQPVMTIAADIVKGLSNYYFTFVDVMDFKDHAREVLTSIDASFVHFDLALNFDLTKAYFELIVTYASLFLMIARVEDRKAVLSLFNHAYDMQKGQGESCFPRLGQMVLEYENPWKKLSEEFTPHSQRVGIALMGLNLLYMRRNLGGDQMRQAQLLSLTGAPQQMLNPALTETVPCEYLSLETMTKWILFCYLLCPTQLTAQPNALDVWKAAMQDGYCISLFRDETIVFHKEIANFFDSMKGYSKRKKEVEECLNQAMLNCFSFHRERRRYLRMAIHELNQILGDQPGLLGPKALIALLALSHAKDEIEWMVRHSCQSPPKGKKINPEELTDTKLPTLLYEVLELRDLFIKYAQVVQRYFVQYLSGFDVAVLKEVIQKISVCPEDESLIMTSFVESLSSISVKQVEVGDKLDFRGLRLDWMRLQAYTSVRGSVPELMDARDLATLMNTIVLHTKLVDNLNELLNDVSDLSIFCFYPSYFENTFVKCLDKPEQMRFSIAFPVICSHFLNATHDLCPEESLPENDVRSDMVMRLDDMTFSDLKNDHHAPFIGNRISALGGTRHPLGDRSLTAINSFLDAIGFKATHFISQLCEEHLQLGRQTLASNAVSAFTMNDDTSKGKKEKVRAQVVKPGEESRKKTVENVTPSEMKYQGQVDLLLSITHVKDITVWDHVFSPKEYLVSHIEDYFAKTVFRMLNYDEATQEIARPSDLLREIKSYMTTLHRLEEFVNLDMARIFNTTLLQQTQNCDSSGGPTLASTYTMWYVDVFLKRVTSTGGIILSPSRHSFVSRGRQAVKAEDYTSVTEMRALAELLGAYGVKHFSRKMMNQVVAQVEELKKLVVLNKDVLHVLRDHFSTAEQAFEQIKRIRSFDDVIARTTIIGVVLWFRTLLFNGLAMILPQRVPFLMKALSDFKDQRTRNDITVTHEMALAAGIETEFDAELYQFLRSHREKEEEDASVWTLLLVFWAVSIPTLAYKDSAEFNPALEAHDNNAHCMAKAINALSEALFTITEEPLEEKMRDFLAICSSSLLKLAMEVPSKEMIPKHRESAYILLDMIVKESRSLTADELDKCFPYALMRDAYHHVYKVVLVEQWTTSSEAFRAPNFVEEVRCRMLAEKLRACNQLPKTKDAFLSGSR